MNGVRTHRGTEQVDGAREHRPRRSPLRIAVMRGLIWGEWLRLGTDRQLAPSNRPKYIAALITSFSPSHTYTCYHNGPHTSSAETKASAPPRDAFPNPST